MSTRFEIQDGLRELTEAIDMSAVIAAISQTARWVHPDSFRTLPVWYPETARGRPIYNAKWQEQYTNTNRATGKKSDKTEANVEAGKAFVAALGTKKIDNWTVCHIWGVDNPKFQKSNSVIRDPRYYSCVGNMVWLPTPLKGFTDAVPEIKQILRVCAFHLYGWACEHEDVAQEASKVRSGFIPESYPKNWPAPGRAIEPPGTAPFNEQIEQAVSKRKRELRRAIADDSMTHFPRDEVLDVLEFWNVKL